MTDAAAVVVPPGASSLYSDAEKRWFLTLLFLVATSNYLDRNIILVFLEPIKQEFHISDTHLGLLSGLCFSLCYALCGLPVARWADHGNRRTIITVALTIWSLMTVLCGAAQTFWQLAIARLGVGTGSSGAIPAAQSLIAEYFPQARLSSALAVFTAASTVGYVLGFGVGGYIAAAHGWRIAISFVGVLGLPLALLVRFHLAEPRLQRGFPEDDRDRESMPELLSKLAAKRSFLHALAGCVLHFFAVYGALTFVSSFLIRVLHLPLARFSVPYGCVTAVASLIGTLGGGLIADRAGTRDIRWLAWLPAVTCGLAVPALIVTFSRADLSSFLAADFVAWMLVSASLPPVFSAIHAVCGSCRRATAVALVLFSSTLLGSGFGPLMSGALSDALTEVYGIDGLRYSLMLMVSLLAFAAGFFYLFGRSMPADLDD